MFIYSEHILLCMKDFKKLSAWTAAGDPPDNRQQSSWKQLGTLEFLGGEERI